MSANAWISSMISSMTHIGAPTPRDSGLVWRMLTTGVSTAAVRILVVDDFGPWRLSVCWRLEAHKQWQIVGEAEDGLDAIRKAQELKPDIVLLDIGLPKLNGIEAARWIGKLVPTAKILFLTEHNERGLMRAALSSGALGYVLKADAESELLPALEVVLRGEKFVSMRLSESLLVRC